MRNWIAKKDYDGRDDVVDRRWGRYHRLKAGRDAGGISNGQGLKGRKEGLRVKEKGENDKMGDEESAESGGAQELHTASRTHNVTMQVIQSRN